MLQFIMERNLLLYVLAAACAVGVVSQIILKQLYERLIRDTKNTGEPMGRFLQQLRQRFQYCSHLNDKVGDVQSLIRKNLMEFRFWGMSLHQWRRVGLGCLAVSLLCAFGGSAVLVQNGGNIVSGNTYFWMGLLALTLTVVAYGFADTGYREEALEVRLTDYLQNSGAVRDYGEAEEEASYGGANYGTVQETTPIVSVNEGRKSKRRGRSEVAAASETRAQREKRELKENLSRVKAGMQETAAEGEARVKGADILRQMDPGEQERILREVLKEFLS